jgi:TctA family transporter
VPLDAASLGDISKLVAALATAIGGVFAIVKYILARRDKRRRKAEEAKLLGDLEEQVVKVFGTTAGAVLSLIVGFSAGGPAGGLAVANALAQNAVKTASGPRPNV